MQIGRIKIRKGKKDLTFIHPNVENLDHIASYLSEAFNEQGLVRCVVNPARIIAGKPMRDLILCYDKSKILYVHPDHYISGPRENEIAESIQIMSPRESNPYLIFDPDPLPEHAPIKIVSPKEMKFLMDFYKPKGMKYHE